MLLTALLLSATLTSAQNPTLPPLIPWDGASRALMLPATDPWVTPSETTAFRTTPRYDETVAYLQRLGTDIKSVPKEQVAATE